MMVHENGMNTYGCRAIERNGEEPGRTRLNKEKYLVGSMLDERQKEKPAGS